MPTRNINLTDRYDEFLQSEITVGRYKNMSEAVRAGIALLEEQAIQDALKLTVLKHMAEEAFAEIDQGRGIVLKDDAALEAFFAEL